MAKKTVETTNTAVLENTPVENAGETAAKREGLLKFTKMVPKLPVIFIEPVNGLSEDKKIAEHQRVTIGKEPVGEDTLEELRALVGGLENQCDAFAKYVTSRNYRVAVEAIYNDPNVLSPDIVDAVCDIMANLPQFADNSKADNKKKWLEGFKAKKDGAMKLLERAKLVLDAQKNAEEIGDLS